MVFYVRRFSGVLRKAFGGAMITISWLITLKFHELMDY
jgi:hypothetical protein